MREIKYTYTCQRNNGHIFHKIFTIDELKEGQARYWDMVNNIGVGDKTFWREFTGLKDKNGKEIYEGDIINVRLDDFRTKEGYKWIKHTVEWHKSSCRFVISEIGAKTAWGFDNTTPFEVIGNIYESPELLSQ